MNLYGLLSDLKDLDRLNLSVTTHDDLLLAILEGVSREIDHECNRRFYTESRTVYLDGANNVHDLRLSLPEDCLSVSSLTVDRERDGTFDGETWTENSDFWLLPRDSFPKVELMRHVSGDHLWPVWDQSIQVTGIWGYGDGQSASPWSESGVTIEVSAADDGTGTVSAEGEIEVGQTIRLGDEQCYVTAASSDGSNTITMVRGVNGTTASSHAAGTEVYTAKYPARVRQECLRRSVIEYLRVGSEVFQSEGIGDYRYSRAAPDAEKRRNKITLGAYRRPPL